MWITYASASYCTWESCRRCCQVTPNGCFNTNTMYLRVFLKLNQREDYKVSTALAMIVTVTIQVMVVVI